MNNLSEFPSLFPHIEFISDVSLLQNYAHDETENLEFPIPLVARPKSAEEVSEIVQYCYENEISIFPRGAGTGLVGGSLATQNGLMISLEKMSQILEIDPKNFTATVEAGVINFNLQEALSPYQLYFPPDPSSWQSSFIGGNIATNAGGPRAVKYGVTANWVLNLEVVLPSGEITWTGANTLKNVTAYNLTQLFIGSEGTLGIITKAVVKLAFKPKFENTMMVPFYDINSCTEAVAMLFEKGLYPSSLEFMERRALLQVQEYSKDLVLNFNDDTQAQLLISFEGETENAVFSELEKCYELLESYPIGEVFIANTDNEKSRIWDSRRKMAEILRSQGFTIEEDTVVPRSELTQLVNFAYDLADKHSIEIVCYGHAGDGNIHIRIRHPKYRYSFENKEVENILVELFQKVKDLGGTLTAEHGVGIIQKKYLSIFLSDTNISIQKQIKKAIDPKGIMNPSKIFTEN